MSSFTKPLILKFLDTEDKFRYELYEGFEYRVGSEDSDDVIIVPAGFKTDFASVPRAFWSILPPAGLYGKAAVVHDYLYTFGQRSKIDSDNIFLEAMVVLKVPMWQRYTMWKAVRAFGGRVFDPYKNWIEKG